LCLSEAIAKRASGFFLDEQAVEPDLRSFERRKVLESKAGVYSCKVKLFQRWLVTQGYYQILTSIVDNEELAKVKQREELLRVKSDEILALLDKWDVYLGRRISEHQVEAWLSQFSSLEERRLAFTLLRAIRFYSTDLVRTKLAEAHGVVTRGTTWHRKQYESTKRRDILVTYLGGPGHSGAEYARRYGDENAIHPDNIASLEMVHELLAKRSDYKAVVVVDDFIGSGRTVAELLTIGGTALNAISDAVQGKLFMVVVCGMSEGSRLVQKVIEESGLKLQLHVLDTIETATGVFGTNSAVFRDEAERGRARDTAYKYGLELLSDWPLGYGNCEAAVVFDNKIPNNCLPILWVEKKGWRPLFRRL